MDSPRVLIVHGSAPLCASLSQELRELNISADCTPRASQAVGRLERERYDVVLLDDQLPQQGSLAVFEALERRGWPELLIVSVQGPQLPDTQPEAPGEIEYVVTPRTQAEMHDLAARIRWRLEGGQPTSATAESSAERAYLTSSSPDDDAERRPSGEKSGRAHWRVVAGALLMLVLVGTALAVILTRGGSVRGPTAVSTDRTTATREATSSRISGLAPTVTPEPTETVFAILTPMPTTASTTEPTQELTQTPGTTGGPTSRPTSSPPPKPTAAPPVAPASTPTKAPTQVPRSTPMDAATPMPATACGFASSSRGGKQSLGPLAAEVVTVSVDERGEAGCYIEIVVAVTNARGPAYGRRTIMISSRPWRLENRGAILWPSVADASLEDPLRSTHLEPGETARGGMVFGPLPRSPRNLRVIYEPDEGRYGQLVFQLSSP